MTKFFPDSFICFSFFALDEEYERSGLVISLSSISFLILSIPSNTICVDGNIILQLLFIESKIF